jgi:F-type H+-transporting ATPase subunit delta
VSSRAVARRYAKALADLGQQHGTLQNLHKELLAIDALVSASADLQRLVSYPLIAPADRTKAFNAILRQAGASDTIQKFFQVVTQASRLSCLHDIVACYGELVDKSLGVVEAKVVSAQSLSPSQSQHLVTSLGGRTGKTIRVQWRQDPTLLGGIQVQIGSTVYDASLLGRLRLLRTQLLSA